VILQTIFKSLQFIITAHADKAFIINLYQRSVLRFVATESYLKLNVMIITLKILMAALKIAPYKKVLVVKQ
jgi:hypothetical protein